MKKAIMNTVVILFVLAGCIGCSQSSKQQDESVTKEATETKEQAQAQVKEESEPELVDGEEVLTVVEVMPKYPGGDAELLKFIAQNIKYPKESQEKGEKGRVICSFVVAKDGSLKKFEVVRGIAPLLDAEAIRVLKTMPLWAPGTNGGKPVAVKYTVPITFKLQ